MSEINYKSEVEAVDAFVGRYKDLTNEIGKVIVGQDEVIKKVLISIFSRGHCLLVGVPGSSTSQHGCAAGYAPVSWRLIPDQL